MVPLHNCLAERRSKYSSLQHGGAAGEYMLNLRLDDDSWISCGWANYDKILYVLYTYSLSLSLSLSLPPSLPPSPSLSLSLSSLTTSDEYRGSDWAVVSIGQICYASIRSYGDACKVLNH